MRIAHVLTRLLRAGSEENTIATCSAQLSAGHDVSLIHGRDFDPALRAGLDGGLRVIAAESLCHPIRPAADGRALIELRRIFADLRPDIVHTHQSKAGILGRFAAHLAGVPHIIHGVHIVPFVNVAPPRRRLYAAAERKAARVTDAFVDVSAALRDACLAEGIGRPDNHFVVYSGMDVARFEAAEAPENWRGLCGVGATERKPPVVLMLAALEPRKRHLELLDAFGPVVARCPNVRLLLAGEDGPQRSAVQRAVAAKGLERNVRLLGFHPAPERLIALADICLLTSMREGLPRVVVQYLAGGRPAVVCDLPGLGEILDHGVNGLVTDAHDLGDTARALVALLGDDDTRARLSAGARSTDLSHWRRETMCARIDAVYAQVADGPAR